MQNSEILKLNANFYKKTNGITFFIILTILLLRKLIIIKLI